MPSVNSRAISFIEYNSNTKILKITFTSGNSYDYYNFPESLYNRFLNSPSKGTFYNDHIRDQY
jgi:hypothetical protein